MNEGYAAPPWPAEDGGPRRLASAASSEPLGLQVGDRLVAHSREAFLANMVVLRAPGDVYLQGCSGPHPESFSWVERIDPESLAPLDRSPELEGGPFWPGGVAVHANGDLYTVYGRWAHRLAPDCSLVASTELPAERPYNSFVVLPGGQLVTKDLDLEERAPTALVALDPEALEPVGEPVAVPEPAIARLSADGDAVYVVGTHHVYRYVWDPAAAALVRDDGWTIAYVTDADHAYGWDPVVALGSLWWMDNGRGATGFAAAGGTMRGCGEAPGALRLWRASLDDPSDREAVEVSGRPHGFICNPPLVDEARGLVVAFDAGNAVVSTFRPTAGGLVHQWSHELAHAAHMLCWPATGELLVGDHRREGDHAVVLDIVTGEELARVATGSPVQSVVFPAPGWSRDCYVCSFATLTRVWVEQTS